MHYRHGTPDQFDRTKDSLKNPAAGVSSKPRALLDAMNYAGSFPGFSTKVKFRSKQGANLKVGTSPLYARATDSLIHYVETRKPLDSGALHEPDPDAGPAGSQGLPPLMAAPLSGFAFMDEPAAIKQRQPRISTPMLSSVLGIIVAVAVGLAIASGNSFKIKTGVDTEEQEPAATLAPSAALGVPPPPSTQERTPVPARPVMPAGPARAPMAAIPAPQIEPVAPAMAAIPALRQNQSVALSSDHANSAPVVQLQPKNRALPKQRAKPPTRTAQANTHAPPQVSPHTAKKVRRNAAPAQSPSRQAPTRRPYSDQEPAYTAEARPPTRTQYARCSQESGLFRRERCKWRVCDGKWGQDGCPAYKHKATPFIGAMALGDGHRHLPELRQGSFSTIYHGGAPLPYRPDAGKV